MKGSRIMRNITDAMVMVLVFSVSAHAALVPVKNGDFETTGTPVYPDGAIDWVDNGYGIGTLVRADSSSTSNKACTFNDNSSGQVLDQIIGYGITKGYMFTLSFDVNSGGDASYQKWESIQAALYARHPSLHTLELIGKHKYYRADEFSGTAYEWQSFSDSHIEDGTHNGWQVYVQFFVQGPINNNKAPFLDNVVITEFPPPPLGTLIVIQ